MENKENKFYLPGTEIDEPVYNWLKEKAEKEKRSLTKQLLWELEQLSKGMKK